MLSLMVSLHLWVLFEMVLVSPLYSNDVAVILDMFDALVLFLGVAEFWEALAKKQPGSA
jgi:hypothetical protein